MTLHSEKDKTSLNFDSNSFLQKNQVFLDINSNKLMELIKLIKGLLLPQLTRFI